WMPYLPVISAARLGAQTVPAVYQRVKIVPCLANRSRCGVFHSFRPLKPTSDQPRSSAKRKTKLGLSAAVVGAARARRAARESASRMRGPRGEGETLRIRCTRRGGRG